MNQKAYVISATWGEYDDFTSVPLFVCLMDIERDLFVDALYNKESPYYDKVVDYFNKEYPNCYGESHVPEDIGFTCNEVDILTFLTQHPPT